MDQPFDSLFDLQEDTEIGNGCHLALDAGARAVFARNFAPGIGSQLFDAEGKPFVFGIDVEDNGLDRLPLAEDFTRMLDPLGPGDVGNVDKSVDAVLDADEKRRSR